MTVNPTNHEVIDAIANRWSPYRFETKAVEDKKLVRCLEAARWAASSFNDQPWSWIIAKRQDTASFDRMLGCLLEANQPWAAKAGVLMISVIRPTFQYNGQPNRVALHDLGQAAAHLALQAAELGLQVHQMAGLNLTAARLLYGIPEGHQPETAIALGYPDTSEPNDDLGRKLNQRDQGERKRLGIHEQVFSGTWGNPAKFDG
ncbi:malonic semialdehyde reductase [Rubripirellula tenax]|uniref:Malonic semialdehyde reductase n=1 Tax=Rubripirellula tenax TaxID=2528015 RepID=A0A5C6EK18_9BACT|nr:nitroreductase family protein [Rubripirellula tenax]TWU48850.1 malonic semialdehyde reductase [Rubripirellula tenax]